MAASSAIQSRLRPAYPAGYLRVGCLSLFAGPNLEQCQGLVSFIESQELTPSFLCSRSLWRQLHQRPALVHILLLETLIPSLLAWLHHHLCKTTAEVSQLTLPFVLMIQHALLYTVLPLGGHVPNPYALNLGNHIHSFFRSQQAGTPSFPLYCQSCRLLQLA